MGGATAFIQKRVQLYQIQRGHQPGIMQHFANQMGFSHRCATRNRGANRWRHRGVQEINIQRDMQQPIGRRDPLEKLRQRPGDTIFIYVAHILAMDLAGLQGLARVVVLPLLRGLCRDVAQVASKGAFALTLTTEAAAQQPVPCGRTARIARRPMGPISSPGNSLRPVA